MVPSNTILLDSVDALIEVIKDEMFLQYNIDIIALQYQNNNLEAMVYYSDNAPDKYIVKLDNKVGLSELVRTKDEILEYGDDILYNFKADITYDNAYVLGSQFSTQPHNYDIIMLEDTGLYLEQQFYAD